MLLHVILIKLISSQKREEQTRKQEEIYEGWMEVREVVRGKYDKKTLHTCLKSCKENHYYIKLVHNNKKLKH